MRTLSLLVMAQTMRSLGIKCLDEEENVLPKHHGQATSTVNKGKDVVVAGFRDEDDGYDSEELPDLPSSDEEGDVPLKKYPLHKDLKNMSEYKWEVGTLYLSRDQFKDCVISVAVHSGRGLSFKKCDDRRVKAFMRRIAEDPNVKLATLVKKAHTKWNVDLTLSKAARVKQHALAEINGTFREQYKRLYDCGAELLKANPGSSVVI
ncbi:hypothetical protein PIB30_022563 [Stylosanthes scabra]|uniref:Uncharacterized protein n=1 Tax=Stylosanthes scabra TaxID=79078 RepID=A0ABU6Y7J3_9FABA|nr:hypothetical protein [Stylosanthes scabra]